MPTEQQIAAGQRVADELFDAKLDQLEGSIDWSKYEFKELVQLYLDHKIVSVTAIYLAMEAAKG